MNEYATYVIRLPSDVQERQALLAQMESLKPHITAMSLEDEVTVLECIENHPDFDDYIADDARRQAKELARLSKESAV